LTTTSVLETNIPRTALFAALYLLSMASYHVPKRQLFRIEDIYSPMKVLFSENLQIIDQVPV